MDALWSRRLLLAEVGTAIGVFGTFLMPGHWGRVLAAARRETRGPRHAVAMTDLRRAPLVMLDPGHGGRDPGAIGVSGTFEKHISLAAALELKRLLETGRRYRVAITRATDIFVPLEQRVEIAQRQGAALFVSMHADALPEHNVRGASVYTLANSASDAQTAELAARENSADRFLGPAYKAVPPEVAQILSSLVRRETRVGSVRLARQMVDSLEQDVRMLPNPDRHAGFVVLQSAEIPSVLVEMGFMSNPQDEAFLRQPAHRTRVAAAMNEAVDAYFATVATAAAAG